VNSYHIHGNRVVWRKRTSVSVQDWVKCKRMLRETGTGEKGKGLLDRAQRDWVYEIDRGGVAGGLGTKPKKMTMLTKKN